MNRIDAFTESQLALHGDSFTSGGESGSEHDPKGEADPLLGQHESPAGPHQASSGRGYARDR